MFFDLTNDAQREQFREYVERMMKRGSIVQLTEEKKRTLEQNSFYQLLISYFSSCTGNDAKWVRDTFVKRMLCPDIFISGGRLRSSASLSSDEMKTVISRFQYFAATECEIYLPESDEYQFVISAVRKVRKDRDFIEQPELKWSQ